MTSPVLHPTPPIEYVSPHLGPSLTNSPNTFQQPRTGSHAGRRGASVEAKANKLRPSPLMKPTNPKIRRDSLLNQQQPQQSSSNNDLENSLSPINLDLDASSVMPPPPPPLAPTTSSNLAPITPSSIMNLNQQPPPSHTFQHNNNHNNYIDTTQTSPNLNSILNISNNDFARMSLESDSNYAQMLTGRITNPKQLELYNQQQKDDGNKRSSHKIAEQKRRDSLKHSFDDLRSLLPPVVDDDDSAGLSEGRLDLRLEMKDIDSAQINKGVSKVVLLKLANDYINILNHRIERRDNIITSLRSQIRSMDNQNSSNIKGIDMDDREFLRNIDGVEHEIQQAALRAMSSTDDRRYSFNNESNNNGNSSQKSGVGRGKGRIRGANKLAKQYLHQATHQTHQHY